VGVNGSSGFCASGAAGVNGGGAGGTGRCAGGSGGGGGGESDVRTAPASSGGLTGGGGDPRLVVAGGGGGGGGEYYTAGGSGGSSGGASAGGAGAGGGVNCEALSATGMPGGSGETGPGGGAAGVVQNPGDCPTETAGGSAGTATSGGSGGNGDGNDSTGPGGGGGGYYGGGGGVAVGGFDAPGGGGGSSYAPAGATFATAPSAATTPSVTISWVTSAPTVKISTLDEGTTLTCAVTASNVAGSDSITSGSVNVPVPYVPRCPAAAGPLSGGKLGSIRLGMTREEARRAYRHSSDRGERYEDFFCLTPIGIRVGYASPKLLATLPAPGRASVRGRVVWASTSNPRYAIMGVQPGAVLEAASRRLHVGKVLPIGLNDWYLAPAGSVTAVLKVRHGVVEEVGIADRALTLTRKRQTTFMHSFE